MGTSSILQVPIAAYAVKAQEVIDDKIDDADADPMNEIQTVVRSGDSISLTRGGGAFLGSN